MERLLLYMKLFYMPLKDLLGPWLMQVMMIRPGCQLQMEVGPATMAP